MPNNAAALDGDNDITSHSFFSMNRGIEQGGKYPWETGEMPSTSRPSFRSRDVIPNVIARAKVGRMDPAGPLRKTLSKVY